jgi:hypothetical protein
MIPSPHFFDRAEIWAGALCTLGIYSLLYRENPVYRFFEYLFLGVGAAYGATRIFQDNLITEWWRPLKDGQWWWMIPFLFGLMYFGIYTKKFAWMPRMLIGTLMGLAAGQQIQIVAVTYFPQITDSFRPLWPSSVTAYQKATDAAIVATGAAARTEALNNIVFFITLIAVMSYFFFSFEHRAKPVQYSAKLGRWLLMISFGTMFGSTITARVALAVSRIVYVLGDWMGLVKS